jgi:ABC-type glycerol-3-phosphate transport system substrate-binding protein
MKLKMKKIFILMLLCSVFMSACIGSDEADAAFGTITINLGGDESRAVVTFPYPPEDYSKTLA